MGGGERDAHTRIPPPPQGSVCGGSSCSGPDQPLQMLDVPSEDPGGQQQTGGELLSHHRPAWVEVLLQVFSSL